MQNNSKYVSHYLSRHIAQRSAGRQLATVITLGFAVKFEHTLVVGIAIFSGHRDVLPIATFYDVFSGHPERDRLIWSPSPG